MPPHVSWQLLIDKSQPQRTLLAPLPAAEPVDGQIAVRVDRFAVTANTITYVLLGRAFNFPGQAGGYWDFFPPAGDLPDGKWGVVPVWGIGTVVGSAHADIAVGEEIYGFWPFASHAVLTVGRVRTEGLDEASPHRAVLPAAYGDYSRLTRMAPQAIGRKELWPVYRPLLSTGFLIADQFESKGDYGAERIVFASASSKTAMLTAHCIGRRASRPNLMALTSARSRDHVASTGLYDQVATYDQIEALDPSIPTAYVDMAGDDRIIARVHERLAGAWRFGMLVGKSHAEAALTPAQMAKAGLAPFFAPARMQARLADWGGAGLRDRLQDVWTSFGARADSLATLETHAGPEAAQRLYLATLAGRADSRAAAVVDPADSPSQGD